MRQKLLVISPFLGRSGMERNLAYFFEHYPQSEFEIGFVYFERLYPETETSPLEKSLSRITRVWQIKVPKGFSLLKVGTELSHIINHWQPQVILGKEWFAACAAVFARSRLPLDSHLHPRVVALIENDPEFAFLQQVASERLSRPKKVIYKHLLQQCAAVVGVSRGVTQAAGRVFKIPSKKLHTVYNGVDVETIWEQAAESPHHKWLKHSRHEVSGIPVVVSCARLSPEKNVETLIRAVALVNKQQRLRAIILGTGKELLKLRQLNKRLGVYANIDFYGYAANPFSFMSKADAFVMTSVSEGFPSVLLEAFACDVPVIYTNCPYGPGEIIQHGKNGLLVPMRDPEAVAQAISFVLNNPDAAHAMAKTAARTIKHFEVKKTVRHLSAILK